MFIVCGYSYQDKLISQFASVKQFGVYHTKELAWERLCTVLDTNEPKPTGFSQSYFASYGVLWIHELHYGDNIFQINTPPANI